jgi:hypothetical protein
MSPHGLRLLNWFSTVLECGLLGCNGELKSQLSRLCQDVAAASDHDVAQREMVLSQLQMALASYTSGDYRSGADMLCRASRTWWGATAP